MTDKTTPQTAAVPAIKPITTKHLCIKFGMKGTALRRILRTMDPYADGVHTNYAWTSLDCPEVKAIEARLKALQAAKVERAKAAQAALAARVAATEAAKKADAAATAAATK
jgi:hypothetical protein